MLLIRFTINTSYVPGWKDEQAGSCLMEERNPQQVVRQRYAQERGGQKEERVELQFANDVFMCKYLYIKSHFPLHK